jgi:hypothetical protein
MPVRLTAHEQAILRDLSEPVDQRQRHAFLQEAERRIEEAAGQSEIGVGLVHRIARATQKDFYDAPDLRQGRTVTRG